MVRKTEIDQFLTNERQKSSSKCHSRWWHQGYPHQDLICRIIESFQFRAIVILLVIIDTGLIITEIMLDSIKIHYECDANAHHLSKKSEEIFIERIDFAMEVAHFTSIGILGFFVIELIVRIYAFAKEFWNYRRKKMEYFDAFIVITSLILDIYLLRIEKKILREQLLMMFSFRLWRFVRIVSSVAEGIRHGERKHKQHLNKQYINAIQRLLELMKYKTNYINETNEDLKSTFEHFQTIDNQCQSSLEELNRNRELPSSLIVARFIEQLNGIESQGDDSTIAVILIKPSLV